MAWSSLNDDPNTPLDVSRPGFGFADGHARRDRVVPSHGGAEDSSKVAALKDETLALGGNITGLTDQGYVVVGKRLEMLKELVPSAKSVAVIATGNPDQRFLKIVEAPAGKLGLKVLWFEIREPSDLEGAFKAATQAGAGCVLVGGMRITLPHARRVAELAVASRLPAIYFIKPYVEAGGLISYSADIIDIWRRAAVYVDKILKGAKPADLPVEQANKYELAINLKTAKAMGLTIPPSLLGRADEVIQ